MYKLKIVGCFLAILQSYLMSPIFLKFIRCFPLLVLFFSLIAKGEVSTGCGLPLSVLSSSSSPVVVASELDLATAVELSSRGVFKITHRPTGKQYVVRFQTKGDLNSSWRDQKLVTSHIPFETFATRLAALISDKVHINPSERLFEKDSQLLLTELSKKSDRKFNPEKVEGIASISPFVDANPGYSALPIFMKLGEFPAFISQLEEVGRGYRDPNFIVAANRWWENRNTMEMKTFFVRLRSLFPGHKFDSRESVAGIFLGEDALVKSAKDAEELYRRLFKSYPPGYVEQAAEHWAINNILGISDGDSLNVLWDGTQMTAIDMAYMSSRFLAGYQNPNNGEQTVATNTRAQFSETYNPALGKILIESLSPEFLKKLEKLDEDSISQIAKESGLELYPWSLRGMMARAKAFQRRDLGIGNEEVFNFE